EGNASQINVLPRAMSSAHLSEAQAVEGWVPAFAGTTVWLSVAPGLAQSTAFAGDEFREGLLGFGVLELVLGEVALFLPLRFQVFRHLLQQQAFDPLDGAEIVAGILAPQ